MEFAYFGLKQDIEFLQSSLELGRVLNSGPAVNYKLICLLS